MTLSNIKNYVRKAYFFFREVVKMKAFRWEEYKDFFKMAQKQDIEIPKGICADLSDETYLKLYNSTVIHEKPLSNALGDSFKEQLTINKVIEIFKRM